MYTGHNVTVSRFSGASRAFGLPPPKAAGAKRIYFWAEATRLCTPHFPFLCEKKRKAKRNELNYINFQRCDLSGRPKGANETEKSPFG